MNVTDFLAHMRLVLDDPGPPAKAMSQWSDNTIVFHATNHIQSLSRQQAQRDQGFHNFTLILKGTAAVQSLSNVWQWSLPPWVVSISEVRRAVGGIPATGTSTYSPYMWTAPKPQMGDPIPRYIKTGTAGWSFEGNRAFRVWGESQAPDVVMQVAKLPAPLVRAVLDIDAVSETNFRLPAALAVGVEDLAEGAFINAEFQAVSVGTLASNVEVLGEQRRCIYSKAGQIISSSSDDLRRTEIYLENALPKSYAAGDTIETILPIADEHLRLAMLLVARSCYAQIGNVPAQTAIAEELKEQQLLFTNYITPRETAEAGAWRESWYTDTRVDQDKSPAWVWQ